jgi:VIT1/CCC1 family predicted Fe2+/Mn2+ transporter
MSNVLWADNNRVDRGSQLMLARLRGEGWVYGGRLREVADFSENTQVFYRMERYLMPAGLVEEQQRADGDEPRQFRLTDTGSAWLDDHTAEIATPATREEMRELAREGYEAGTSAKESVRNYRKKVSRIKNRVDDVEDEVEDIASKQATDDTTLTILSERSKDNRARSQETKEAVAGLQEEMKTRAATDDLERLSDDVRSIEETLSTIEGKLAGVVRQQAASERTRTQLQRLAKPAGYLVGGAIVAYLVVLAVTVVTAPALVTGVVLAGIGALLGVAIGIGLLIYAQGGNVAATYQNMKQLPSTETADDNVVER